MSWQDIAAQATLCNFGTTGATYAAAAAWGSAYTGQIWGTVGFAGVSAALAAASAASGCYDPDPIPEPPSTPSICCNEWSDSTADVFWDDGLGGERRSSSFPENVQYLYSWEEAGSPPFGSPAGYIGIQFTVGKGDNVPFVVQSGCPPDWVESGCFSLGMTSSGSCAGTAPEPEPILPDPPPPVPIIDPDTNCEWNVTMADAYLNERGNMVILYKATSNDPNVCGPDQYWWDETGKEPTPVQPDPTDPTKPIPPPDPCCQGGGGDCPDPCPEIPQPITLPSQTYQLTGVCEDVAQGQPQPVVQWPIASSRYEQALAARLDAIAGMLQLHLQYKTPTCTSQRPALEGALRSIRWVSDGPSPYSNRPLRKLLRYRSKSGADSKALGVHWGTFEFQAGPVIVVHRDAWWGQLKVWAISEDEGKRVIRHAAAEAGIDPDTEGRWIVTASSDTRYGVKGTMRVDEFDGIPWTTARSGPDGWPTL